MHRRLKYAIDAYVCSFPTRMDPKIVLTFLDKSGTYSLTSKGYQAWEAWAKDPNQARDGLLRVRTTWLVDRNASLVVKPFYRTCHQVA